MFDDVRPVLGGQASRDVVTADIEGLRYQRSLQIGVNLLRDLVDEQGGDGVHLQQVGPEGLEGSESKLTCDPCR